MGADALDSACGEAKALAVLALTAHGDLRPHRPEGWHRTHLPQRIPLSME